MIIPIINSQKSSTSKKENKENKENENKNKENENEEKKKENEKGNKENEEKKKEEEKENKLKKIVDPSLDLFEYIFIDFNDFNNNEISSMISLEQLKDCFKEIKKKEKSNIILNVGKEDGNLKEVIELLKYPDIYIFNNIQNTYKLFKKIKDKLKEIEEEKKKEENKDIKKKKNKKIKKDNKENKKKKKLII